MAPRKLKITCYRGSSGDRETVIRLRQHPLPCPKSFIDDAPRRGERRLCPARLGRVLVGAPDLRRDAGSIDSPPRGDASAIARRLEGVSPQRLRLIVQQGRLFKGNFPRCRSLSIGALSCRRSSGAAGGSCTKSASPRFSVRPLPSTRPFSKPCAACGAREPAGVQAFVDRVPRALPRPGGKPRLERGTHSARTIARPQNGREARATWVSTCTKKRSPSVRKRRLISSPSGPGSARRSPHRDCHCPPRFVNHEGTRPHRRPARMTTPAAALAC